MKRLLVLDSYKALRLLYTIELKADGYMVDTAADTAEALCLLKKQHYDLVIIDIMASGMKAAQELKKLLSRSSKTSVIVNSCYNNSSHKKLLSLNADSYLLKSSDLSELKQKVKESLGETVSVL